MNKSFFKSDLFILILLASAKFALHLLTNHNYGFHRDELATLHDARQLAWGYIAYPPLTPFLASIELKLFGTSLVGFRFFSALAQSAVMVMAGLTAKELGGSRITQILSALGAGIGILTLIQGALFQYVAFDFLWVVLLGYLFMRLINTDDPRWWIAIGIVIGMGMMTRYTMGVHVIALIIAVIATPARKFLKSAWLWLGALTAFLIFLPNLIWQIQNNFISLEFQAAIRARDIAIGRTDGFLLDQLLMPNPFMLPFWLAGLVFLLRSSKYRAIALLSILPVLIFFLLQGRGYYPAPIYVMLTVAGMIVNTKPKPASSLTGAWIAVSLGFIVAGALTLPIAPVNSALWNISYEVHDNFAEQLGWRELNEQVAEIYHALPEDEKPRAAILAGNYGEAGALNLYGAEHNLPQIISPANSFWLQGPPNESIDLLIIVGYSEETAETLFNPCEVAGLVSNSYNVLNEESNDGIILLCRGLQKPWSELWLVMRRFM
ncbi:MAG: glycosyltransferase family 39 protein [Anaerolineales bacterium]|nr:glycosyltransferase family 39 protein [Anaerolineales bacterium]